MVENLKENIKSQSTWVRVAYMILFALIYSIAEIVVIFITVFQFALKLFTGNVNERLLSFSQRLSTFIYNIMLFFMFNSEEKPYPFSAWPKGTPKAAKNTFSKEEKKAKKVETQTD